MGNFDTATMALKSSGLAGNDLLFDGVNMPSVMVWIQKFSWKDIGLGTSTDPFPAFIVNGQEIPGFWFSKYMNVVQNGRAYSIPAQDFGNIIPFNNAILRCTAKGAGWHLTTRLEWMAVALWSLRNGTLPKGNNNYGRDVSESINKAIPVAYDEENRITRVAGGTGPVTWSHTHTQDGIWDMNGNGADYTAGVRTVYGELQVLSKDGVTFGNDAADSENSQASNSALWYAIDGTTGELITPDGTGTTTNSLKVAKISSKPSWITGSISGTRGGITSTVEEITLDASVCDAAKRILQALGFYKPDGISSGDLGGDSAIFDNSEAERVARASGLHSSKLYAGAFYVAFNGIRTSGASSFGFRAAYCDIPEPINEEEVLHDGEF